MVDTNTFMHDLSNTEGNTALLEKHASSLESNLKTIDKDLDLSKTLNGKLHQLNNSLKTASRLLTVVSIIPEIGAEASETKKVIDTFQAPLGRATTASDKVEKVVGPVRKNIETLATKVQQVDDELLKTMNAENSVIAAVGDAQHCIGSLPDGTVKTGLSAQLDQLSSTLDPVVLKFDSVQVETLNIIDGIENEVDTVLSWCRNLVDVNSAIDSVMNSLRPLISALQDIADALGQTIRVPYGGYPKVCKKWGVPYPCGWHTVYFSFTIKQIISGVSGVIEPVMKLLNEAMDKILNPLLKALNLDIHLPTIPGLDGLTDLADHLENTINKIEKEFNQVYAVIAQAEAYYAEIESFVDKIQSIYNECHLTHKT